MDQVAVQPLSVRLFIRILFLELFIIDDPSCHSINQKHLTRMQALFDKDLRRVNVQHAHLGGEDQIVIVRDVISGRTKSVSV